MLTEMQDEQHAMWKELKTRHAQSRGVLPSPRGMLAGLAMMLA